MQCNIHVKEGFGGKKKLINLLLNLIFAFTGSVMEV